MSDAKTTVESLLDEIRRRREEIEVQIHLAKADARSEWAELEDKFEELKAKADKARDVAAETAENLGEALELAASELREGYAKLKKLI